MPKRKSLKDYLLNGDLSKVKFCNQYMNNGRPYQVINLRRGIPRYGSDFVYMVIRDEDGNESERILKTHLNDLEFIERTLDHKNKYISKNMR